MKRITIALMTLAALAPFLTTAARAQEPTRRAVGVERAGATAGRGLEVTAGNGFFVVLDAGKRRLVVYGVDGGSVRLLGARDVEADFQSAGGAASGAAMPKRPPLPSGDAVGQDPPGFARPEGSVRVASSFAAEAAPGQGRWEATYFARGSVAEVYDALKRTLTGWTVEREDVSANPARASLVLVKSGERLEVVVGDRAPEEWAGLEVKYWRR